MKFRTFQTFPRFAAALVFLGGASTFGATLIYEPFDFDAGDLSTESSGAWSDSGTTIEAGGLSYGSLPTSGNRVTMSDDSSWTGTGTALDGALDDGDTLWFSVLVNPHSTSTNPDFGFAIGTDQLNDSNNVPMSGSGSGFGFRVKGGVRATAWVSGAATSGGSAGITAGQTILVVGELIFGATAGDLDTVNIYLPDTSLNLGSIVSSQTATFAQASFDTIAFSNKAASPRDQVDEIRFGTSFAAVSPVPEPGVFALVSLAGLAVLRRRR